MPGSPRFDLGQTLITPRALAALTQEEVIAALGSHVLGDWGEVGPQVSHGNELALDSDGPVVSAYHSRSAGTRFYVVTHGDRSVTTVFLPGEG